MIVIANKTAEYWKKRFEILENASNSYGLDTYRQIESAFEVAQRQIANDINIWFGRFGKNNVVPIDEARKYLTTSELKEFKWDVQEYIQKGRENALNQQWVKELENASAKYHISRLEALKIRTQNAAEVAFGNEQDEIDAMARRVYTDNYYHSIFEVQKGLNIGWDIGQVDANKLSKIISKPWAADGKNFSERIWGQRTQLVNELHQQLTLACVLGKAPDGAIEAIAKKFDVTKKQAGRLVMTEQAYFHSISQKDAFNELEVEEFKIVATLDSHTSDICQEMDGQHFPMRDYQPGVTAPPFHVWCRSVTVPYFEDDFSPGQRAARDVETGETYYVPDNMTYKEWKQSQDELYGAGTVDKKRKIDYNRNADKVQFEKYKSTLKENSPNTLQEFINIKYNDAEKYNSLKYQYRTVNRYEVEGNVPIDTIVKLDNVAWYTKRYDFDVANYKGITNSKQRNDFKNFQRKGNTASMEFEGEIYYSHSAVKRKGTLQYEAYVGKYPLIGLKKKRKFKTFKLGDGIPREFDTEAKFLEFVADQKLPTDTFTVTILSEKHICQSCQGVVKQFKNMFPNSTVNIVSGKKNFNGDIKGNHTYVRRKGYKDG